jgi:error-prone DNA polymerase
VTLRQQPEIANGTVLISLEDETGGVQVIVLRSPRDSQCQRMLRFRLLAAYGKWQCESDVKNLIAEKLRDLALLGKVETSSRDFH